MNEKLNEKEKITSKKRIRFKDSTIQIRASFILSLIMFFLMIISFSILELIFNAGPFILYSIGCIIIAIAITGVILSGLSFREGKNGFGISGFIINLLVVIFQSTYFYVVHVFLHLSDCG